AHQSHGPYYLCGASFGGVIAFEMARKLAALGEEVRFLGLFDSRGGEYPRQRQSLALRKRLRLALLRFFPRTWYLVFTLPWLKSALKEQTKRWLVRRMIALDRLWKFPTLRCPLNLRMLYIPEVCFGARRGYTLLPFAGKIDLFRAEDQPPSDLFEEDLFLGW